MTSFHAAKPARNTEKNSWYSNRHRLWSNFLPCMDPDHILAESDIDGLRGESMVEFDYDKPYAWIETKSVQEFLELDSFTFKTQHWICKQCQIPLLLTIYDEEQTAFWVVGLNDKAKEIAWKRGGQPQSLAEPRWFSEQGYVKLLHHLRKNKPIQPGLLETLANKVPDKEPGNWKSYRLRMESK